jgi:hypothetical protein
MERPPDAGNTRNARPDDEPGAVPVEAVPVEVVQPGPSTPFSRRAAIAWLMGATGVVAGFLAGRTVPPGVPLPSPSPALPTPSESPTADGGPLPFTLNLRPLKPYDLEAAALSWVRSVGGSDIAFYEAESVQEPPIFALRDAVVLAIAVPQTYGAIADVQIDVLAGGPAPTLERLRDLGNPQDLAEINDVPAPKPVAVGDLWVLLPRDTLWVAGFYRAVVTTETRRVSFSFVLT